MTKAGLALSTSWPIIASLAIVIGYHQLVMKPELAARPQVATVSAAAITDGFIKKLANAGLSDDDAKQRAAKFGRDLNKTIADFQQQNGMILLVTEAVIAGPTDYTGQVTALLPEDERP